MFQPNLTSISILAEGYFGTRHAKTAWGVLRYGTYPIHSIIDSQSTHSSILNITGIPIQAPIVASLEEGISIRKEKPDALVLGIAPQGGQLPDSWRLIIVEAIKKGIHIINGLHCFLNDDNELTKLALEHQVKLWDVRNPDNYSASKIHSVAQQKPRPQHTRVITMVGSDCNVGKMTVALELNQALRKRNHKSEFIATGQTGIMISGKGIPLDRIIGDFMAGSTENIIEETITESNPDYILVEGQGSLLHPGYSGVTLSLLHGSNPDMMVLCSKPDNEVILGGYSVPIPNFKKLIEIYETAASWTSHSSKKHVPVIGIALNTSTYSEKEALNLLAQIRLETGLIVVDPVRFGVDTLIETIEACPPVRAES